MASFLLAHEPMVRLAFFAGILVAMVAWETLAPKRERRFARRHRWPGNLGIAALNTVVLRLVFPAAAVGAAVLAEERGWGLLNNLPLPGWCALLTAIVLLDLAV